MEYHSNAQEVINKLISNLSGINTDKLFLEIAQLVYASNLRRIHNEGKDLKDRNIGSYSPNNGHKTDYVKWRRKRGLQTSRVDLRVSGKLMSDLQIIRIPGGYKVAFVTQKSSLISEGQEEHWGKEIWGVSQRDKIRINQIIKKYTNKLNAKA